MGRWLQALCEKEKNTESTRSVPPKTPETTHAEVMGVLGVPDQRVFEKNSEINAPDISNTSEGIGVLGAPHLSELKIFHRKKRGNSLHLH